MHLGPTDIWTGVSFILIMVGLSLWMNHSQKGSWSIRESLCNVAANLYLGLSVVFLVTVFLTDFNYVDTRPEVLGYMKELAPITVLILAGYILVSYLKGKISNVTVKSGGYPYAGWLYKEQQTNRYFRVLTLWVIIFVLYLLGVMYLFLK